MIVLIAISILLRLEIPSFFAFGAIHDDELMVRMAQSLIDGTPEIWSQFAIQKEPGYSYFLALMIKMKLSPVIAVHLMTMVFTYILFRVLRNLVSEAHAAIYAILVVINPALFGVGTSRIYNVSFQTSLVVGLLAAVLRLIVLTRSPKASIYQFLLATFFLFVIIGTMSITRPDWILIAGPLVGGIVFWDILARRQSSYRNLFLVVAVASVFIIPFLSRELVRNLHERSYGVHLVNDVNEGNFKKMMESLARIEPQGGSRFIVVSRVALEKAIRVSPTFSQLSGFLSSRDAELWRSITCDAGGPCDEVAGGYLPLMLRDGIMKSFPDLDARSFQRLTAQISEEVDLACNSGQISCGTRGIGAWLPPVDQLDVRLSALEFVKLLYTRTFSFSDRVVFATETDSNRSAPDIASTWGIIQNDLVGSRDVTRNGTPQLLSRLISPTFSVVSFAFRLFVAIGTILFMLFSAKFWRQVHVVGIGSSMLASVFVFTFFYAVMYANSFGTAVDGGNLAYLLMVQPVAIGVALVGIHLAFIQFRSTGRDLRDSSSSPKAGTEL